MVTGLIYSLFDYSIFLGIATISFVITLVTTIITKKVTDQKRIKKLKEDIKRLNKELQSVGDDKDKMMSVQKQIWPKQSELFKASLIPMAYYGLPILLIFGWLSGVLGYAPIHPGEEFSITAYHSDDLESLTIDAPFSTSKDQLFEPDEGAATRWTATAETPGTYNFSVRPEANRSFSHVVRITNTYGYTSPVKDFEESKIQELRVEYGKITPLGNFDIFGWRPGWLATYILVGLVSNLALRKLFDVA